MESRKPGRHPRKETWSATSLKGGTELIGWVAGPMIGVYGHMFPPFKPCHKELIGEHAKCPHHEYRGDPTFQGVWPLYTDCGKRVVIMVSEDAYDLVQQFKLHDPVRVSRANHKFAALKFEANTRGTWYRATLPERQRPADIRQWMIFTMWKAEHQLVNHYSAHPLATALPTIERGGPTQDTAEKPPKFELKREVLKEVLEQNGHHATAANLPPTMDAVHDELKNRLLEKAKRFHKNGTGG